MNSSFLAGASRVDITPPMPTHLAGYPPIKVFPGGPDEHRGGYRGRTGKSVGMADPLHARVLSVANGSAMGMLVTVDLCLVPRWFSYQVRQRIADACGVPSDSIMIAASHNHSGPDYTGHIQPVDPSVPTFVADAIVSAACQAHAARQPAKAGLEYGALHGISVNRRDPSRPIDPEVPVLRIDREDGSCLAVVFGFACHPLTAGSHNHLFSAEYPGKAAQIVENGLDGEPVALFVQGGAGNINPCAFPFRGQNVVQKGRSLEPEDAARVRSLSEARRVGCVLGGEVLRVAAAIPTSTDVLVSGRRVEVEAEIKSAEDLNKFTANYARDESIVEDWRSRDALLTEVMALRIGPIVFVGMPGEPFVETALELQRKGDPDAGTPAVRLVGYVNDCPGYLPPPDQMVENRYESVATPLSSNGTGAIIDAALQLARGYVS